MHGPKLRWTLWLRRLLLYATIGVALTYASTLFIVALLPITTMNWGCRGVIHRAESGSKPYWRIRIWDSPYGSTLQIHRVAPNAKMLGLYFNLDGMSEDERRETIERAALRDVAFLPKWSRLREHWPEAIEPMDGDIPPGAMWYQVRAGWPFLALGGEYVTTEPGKVEVPIHSASVLLFTRNTAFTGPWAGYWQLIAMPLIPQGMRFAGCVAFYGLLAFCVTAAIQRIRRWGTRAPGLCKICGYDLRGSTERCPECGTPFV